MQLEHPGRQPLRVQPRSPEGDEGSVEQRGSPDQPVGGHPSTIDEEGGFRRDGGAFRRDGGGTEDRVGDRFEGGRELGRGAAGGGVDEHVARPMAPDCVDDGDPQLHAVLPTGPFQRLRRSGSWTCPQEPEATARGSSTASAAHRLGCAPPRDAPPAASELAVS